MAIEHIRVGKSNIQLELHMSPAEELAKKLSPAEKTVERLTTFVPRIEPIPETDFLSTGCTILNLACSGKPNCGIPKGTYFYLIGDSSSGKSWLTFCFFAEASINPNFKDHRFIFDNAENGALWDVVKFFGQSVFDRLEPPRLDKDEPVYSKTVQEFYYNLDINCSKGPCIYVLDSMDAVNDDVEEDKFEAEVKHYETGKGEIPGSMGTNKARTNSKNINRVTQALRKNGSILIIISQTRDKIGSHIPGLKTRSGGRALKSYAHLELWTAKKGDVKKTYQRKEREIGALLQFDMQKNRVCGWEGKLPLITFLKKHGIDDVGTNVEYLLDERHWVKEKKATKRGEDEDNEGSSFTAPEFDFVGRKEALVKHIQEQGQEKTLAEIVGKVWQEIESGAALERKARYT